MSVNDDRHLDAAVRAAELKKLEAHERQIRAREREMCVRAVAPCLNNEPDPDFPGCVW